MERKVVRCADPGTYNLTPGWLYTVRPGDSPELYAVRDDAGVERQCYKWRFEETLQPEEKAPWDKICQATGKPIVTNEYPSGTVPAKDTQEVGADRIGGVIHWDGPAARDTQVGGNHYSKLRIQPYEYITANGIGMIEGNVIKYVTRWKDKNGVEDLKKAVHSLQWLIEYVEKNGMDLGEAK